MSDRPTTDEAAEPDDLRGADDPAGADDLPEAELDPVDELIEAAIFRALDRLPPVFRDQLGSVAIVVEDEPTADQLASVHARDLFGLYQGVPRTRLAADGAPVPSKITLFRRTLVRHHPTPEALGEAVEDTVLHEVAHHFGIDDDRLHELQRRG